MTLFIKNSLKYLPLALLLAVVACNQSGDKPAETIAVKPADSVTLQREYTTLRDTLDGRWARMMASDDEKLLYQTRLLQHISYIPTADMVLVKQLDVANERLKTRRYEQQTMISDSINAYDSAQVAYLVTLREFASKYIDPEKRRVIGDLIESIMKNDDMVVRYRGSYDQAARAYNAWLQQHEGQLPAAKDAKPVPLFSLSGV